MPETDSSQGLQTSHVSEGQPTPVSAIDQLRAKYPEYRKTLQDQLLTPLHDAMEETLTMSKLFTDVYYSDGIDPLKRQESFDLLIDKFDYSAEEKRERFEGKSIDHPHARNLVEANFSLATSNLNVVFSGIEALSQRDSPLMHDIAEVRYEGVVSTIRTRLFDPSNQAIPEQLKYAFLDRIQRAHDAPDRSGVSVEFTRPDPNQADYELTMQFWDELHALEYLGSYDGTIRNLALEAAHNNFVLSGQSDRFNQLSEEIKENISSYIRSRRDANFFDGVDLYSFHSARASIKRYPEEIEITNAIFGKDALRNLEHQAQEQALRQMIVSDLFSSYEVRRIIDASDYPDSVLVGQAILNAWGNIRENRTSQTALNDLQSLARELSKKENFTSNPDAALLHPIIQEVTNHRDTFSLPSVVDVDNPIGKQLTDLVTQSLNTVYKQAHLPEVNPDTVIQLVSQSAFPQGLNQHVSNALQQLHLQVSDIPMKPNPLFQLIENNLQQICIDVIHGDEQHGLLASPIVIDSFIQSLHSRVSPELLHTYSEWFYHSQNPEVLTTLLKQTPDYSTLISYAKHIATLPPTMRDAVAEKFDISLLSFCSTQDELLPEELAALSYLSGIDASEIKDVTSLFGSIYQHDAGNIRFVLKEEQWKTHLKLARHPRKDEVLQALAPISFTINPEQLGVILASPDGFIDQIKTITTFAPSFKYETASKRIVVNPYDALITQSSSLSELYEPIAAGKGNEGFSQGVSYALYRNIKHEELTDARANSITSMLQQLADAINNPEKISSDDKAFYDNRALLTYLMDHAQEVQKIIDLPTTHKDFVSLLRPGGVLYKNREIILHNMFETSNPYLEARKYADVFTKKRPYWESLYFWTQQRLTKELHEADTEYPISQIEGIVLSEIRTSPRLSHMIDDQGELEQIRSGKSTTVPFRALAPLYKDHVFRDYLRRTIETSQNNEAKQDAHKRNVARVASLDDDTPYTLTITPTTRIHGSAVDFIELMLLNGNICGEGLGENAKVDSYSFQVDFSIPDTTLSGVEEILSATISSNLQYGGRGKLYADGQIFYLYERAGSMWEPGVDYGPEEADRKAVHSLLFGGIPATEISGLVLRNPLATQGTVKKQIISNGFYIPLYDMSGHLLFTPEEYEALYADLNMQVSVERIERKVQLDGQQGSNRGGVFAIPEAEGPVQYYIKFGDNEGHIWNEQLADNLYRHANIPVPNTKIVSLDGSLGHASEILPESTRDEITALNGGALMDMWLANWDAIAHEGNILHGYRVDNGGALLYHANGDEKGNRKETDRFGEQVVEFFSMRYGYPGLTDDELRSQAEKLTQAFPNDAIESVVNSVRLPQAKREFLIQTLIRRRDYLYKKTHEAHHATEVTSEGQHFLELLEEDEFHDEAVAILVPEWRDLIGENGYQHNGVLLGQHLKEALQHLKSHETFQKLSSKEKYFALLATFFHDFAKPIGTKENPGVRDVEHEKDSARVAATYMAGWGYAQHDINIVQNVIIHDGIVSDLSRGKVGSKTLDAEKLYRELGNNRSTARILQAVNTADVLANVNPAPDFWIKYDAFFSEMLGE